ncbi:hypothetical protein AB0G79_30095 [Streptomyces sp. NPDC020807]|uniref:hypothetical protein n=1 Tax=Streptomyces sp. NPDC020807 TaxID=3155119 RepID=UPI0033DC0129
MSQEAAPERAVSEPSGPQPGTPAPKGLLQQMEELMAALSADLSQLDADIQSSADRTDQEQPQHGEDGTYETSAYKTSAYKTSSNETSAYKTSTPETSTRETYTHDAGTRRPHDGAPSSF